MTNDIQQLRETLESVDVLNPARAHERINEALQELQRIEAARAKDAELIQTLADALDQTRDAFDLYASCRCDGSGCPVCRVMDKADNALFAAIQQGFKPSQP